MVLPELCLFLILASGITPTIADDISYPCRTPTDRATEHINKFVQGADN